jgi:hypothetical protein
LPWCTSLAAFIKKLQACRNNAVSVAAGTAQAYLGGEDFFMCKRALCIGLAGATVSAAIAMTAIVISAGRVKADDPNSAPNPYHVVDN